MSGTDTRAATPAGAAAPAPTGPSRAPRRVLRIRARRFLSSSLSGRLTFPFVCLAVWFGALEIVSSIWPFAVDVLPRPTEVANFMWNELRGETLTRLNLYETFAISLKRLGIGMALAMVIGTVVGLAMGISKSVNAFFNDWVVAVLAMPNLAWALFCSLAFGFGDVGPIVTVVLTGIPFVIINVREGVRNAPTDLYDMARAFGVTRAHIIRHVLIPSLMPFLFAAGRYAFALGWKGLVVAEVFGGDSGAGWTIKWWYDAHSAHGVIGYAFFFVIFALLCEKFVFDRLSRYFFRWRPEVSSGAVVEERFDTPAEETAAAASSTNTAALESLTQVTAGPRSERTDEKRNHDG
jgi:ABC-type nitrate/sulfonate/bicarbonate transport system permease component